MKQFILIGKPLGHSLSPALFRHWFRRHGIDATYRAIEAEEDELDGILERLAAGEFAGANVTSPYKEAVLPKLFSLDEAAAAIGAVNTLVRAGKDVRGLNTDAFGFSRSLEGLLGNSAPSFAAACVFGGGGAARAVVHALVRRGTSEIRVVGRNPRAVPRIRQMGPAVTGFSWDEAATAARGAGLLVNATPLGTAGFPPFPGIPLNPVPGGAALDLVYNPPRTAFLDWAGAAGFKTANGFSMLVFQAAAAFEAWLGLFPDVSGVTHEGLAGKQDRGQP